MTAGAPPALTVRMSPKPASDNSFDTASALRCTSPRRAGSAHTDSMRIERIEIGTHGRQHCLDTGDEITHPTEASRFPMRTNRAKDAETCAVTPADTSHSRCGTGLSRLRRRTPAPPPPRRCRLRESSDKWMVMSLRCSAMAPVQPHPRPSPHVGDYLDVAVDALGQHRPLAEPRTRPRLDHGLLGRPPSRQVPRRRRTLVRGVAALTRGERLGEDGARLVDLLGEVRNGDQVDAYPDYAHARKGSSCRRPISQAPHDLLFAQALMTARTSRPRPVVPPDRAAWQPPAASPATRGRSVGRPASRRATDRPRWPTPTCADPPAPGRWPGAGSPRAAAGSSAARNACGCTSAIRPET